MDVLIRSALTVLPCASTMLHVPAANPVFLDYIACGKNVPEKIADRDRYRKAA